MKRLGVRLHARQAGPGFACWMKLNVWHVQAANAGGVAVSALEMAQNSARLSWSSEEVDQKLKVSSQPCKLPAHTLAVGNHSRDVDSWCDGPALQSSP